MIARGQLQPCERILIHAGTGAIGMSAISIALSLNCEIFTTVSTVEKKQYLKKMFPQLQDENIGKKLVIFSNLIFLSKYLQAIREIHRLKN